MLKDRMRADLRVYRRAIEALDLIALQGGKGVSFDKAARETEIAQRTFMAARDRLNQHTSSHGCE